ncbi:sugar nucleotide-binding protein [Chryseobacterium chendengshani]|uniref:NAD-dependent epimerase/dehydratase family protein n=1 Tax=Chryseobacterium sp. LJ668 TaxID=2864040 RepID=UPI001C688B7D|nr:NAD-dependent epimerase/dehydratase family protein [Chryseobacterium sp. LJ668]MBW8521831.1 sugar nucleotide-binding protein [Chryseobacterium sp. LJ668]QYK17491.1 sugar nucleotide-binding protein [Chryseobacterium sp. LJ668]
MIVGRGLIASLFTDCDKEDTIFFASGVSNSLETKTEEFLREENLIRKIIAQHSDKIFVYFSTCSVYDSSKTGSFYLLHKLKMEQIIKNTIDKFLILRVSNAVGKGGNPNLLMNYIVNAVKNNETINVHTKATRNLIDAEDVKNITFDLLQKNELNKIINVAYTQNYSIIEILETVENFYSIKPQINLIRSGAGYDIRVAEIEEYFQKNNMISKDIYIQKILKKYYSE